jgi:hypothetical protein
MLGWHNNLAVVSKDAAWIHLLLLNNSQRATVATVIPIDFPNLGAITQDHSPVVSGSPVNIEDPSATFFFSCVGNFFCLESSWKS